MSKVKAEQILVDKRARLMHMVAKHFSQRAVEKMRRAVSAADRAAALHTNRSLDAVTYLERSALQHAVMHVFAALVLLDVIDFKETFALDFAMVAQLAAHLGIEAGAVKHDDRLAALADLIAKSAFGNDGQHLCLAFCAVISDKHRVRHGFAEFNAGPAEVAQRLARFACAYALLLHQILEFIGVDAHSLVGAHLDRQIDRETVGVIKLERVGTGEGGLPFCLVLGKQIGEDLHAGVDRLVKALFLGADYLSDIILLFAKLGILALVFMDDGIDDLVKESVVHAKQLAVACSPAQQAAQDIAASLVRGQNAVADQERG